MCVSGYEGSHEVCVCVCVCVSGYEGSHEVCVCVCVCVCVSQGTKAVMKDIAKYMPGIGWSFIFMEYPRLKRDWTKDKDRLQKSCQKLCDYPVNMLVSGLKI